MILFPSTGPHSGLIYENDGLYIRLMYSGCWKYFIRMMKCIFLGFFCKEDRNMDSHCTCTFDSYTKHFIRQKPPLLVVFHHYVLCNLTGLWLWILRVGVQQANAGTYGLAFTECSIPQYQIYCKNKHVKPMKINTYAIKFSLYQK